MKLLTVRRARSRLSDTTLAHSRQRIVFLGYCGIFVLVLLSLGYWQVVKAQELSIEADDQYQRVQHQSGERGSILFSDGKPLVLNREVYRFYTKPNLHNRSSRRFRSRVFKCFSYEQCHT